MGTACLVVVHLEDREAQHGVLPLRALREAVEELLHLRTVAGADVGRDEPIWSRRRCGRGEPIQSRSDGHG